MSAAQKLNLIAVEDYLAGELTSPVKHEYLGGVVYAMTGGTNVHHMITGNIYHTLRNRLRGAKCLPFNSDTKLRVRLPTHWRFYYPDCSVICRPNPPNDTYQDDPSIVFEVISKSSRRTDGGEKKDGYLTIPALSAYVMVEQSLAKVVVHRRTESGFVPEVYEGLDSVIPLPEINVELPLAEIYEGIVFVPEASDDDS
jgi:Uma2 family endonuclease